MSVPYHTLDLDEKLSYKQDKADGNLIIEGDNLPALKSLLPEFSGKIGCIYIDPPYNTGNEGWVYNDKVSSPLIKEWLGNVVNKDDLTRHDKWLSMMTPRLKLMRDLLAKDGVIFVSIDDNENSTLLLLLSEVFGEENFLGNLIWRKKAGGGSDSSYFVSETEYIVAYARNISNLPKFKIPYTEEELKRFSLDDDDNKGQYYLKELARPDRLGSRPNLQYPLICPDGSKLETRSNGKKYTWVVGKEKYGKMMKDGEIIFKQIGNGEWRVYRKVYAKSKTPRALLYDIALNREATSEMRELFGDDSIFDNPKPTKLIKYLINTVPNQKLILDAFAGSGTTAQAVLELNEEDEGNRKFILIQMPENSEKEPKKNIARDITRERVVKVIEKRLKSKDIGFEYRRVGQPIDAETILSGQLPTFKQLAKYVYYLATGQSPKDKDINEKKYLAGKVDHTEVYLLYTPDIEELKKMAITFEWAKEISKGNEYKKIVYAPACFMDDEYLEQFNIKFVSIPYNLFEREQ